MTGPQGSANQPLRFGLLGSPATLDPFDPRASDLTYTLARPVYPSLYRFLPDGTPQPDLVEELTERRRSAEVRLARARWSDGTPITAPDVAASARRAIHPSGFSGLRVEILGPRALRFTGGVVDWEERLATATYVLPGGRAGTVYGGPYTIDRFTEGYQVVLKRNPDYFGERALSQRIAVRVVQDLDLMLLLLERGRLDAAAPLATLNLDDRLEVRGLSYDRAIGWESIWLDLARSRLSSNETASLLGDVKWPKLEESFVRDEGELTLGSRFVVRASGSVRETLLGSTSDELVALVMRAAWFQLRASGHRIELLRVDPEILYGKWRSGGPAGIALRRATGAPGLTDPLGRGEDALRVFEVASFVTWQEGVGGLAANPTLDGPLWDAGELVKP